LETISNQRALRVTNIFNNGRIILFHLKKKQQAGRGHPGRRSAKHWEMEAFYDWHWLCLKQMVVVLGGEP